MRAQTLLLLGIFAIHRPASAQQRVEFESASFQLGGIQARQAIERGEVPKAGSETIAGYLSKPDGDRSFAAVVYLHGCSGLSKSTQRRIAELMTGWGYVSLAVDSYATRGIKETCLGRFAPTRQGDALGALLFLSKLPFVDPGRIAVIGASQGGLVALELASTHNVDLFEFPKGLNFKAAVAYYPMCTLAAPTLTIPTTILIGELDDWASAKDCERWMALRAGKGAPVKLAVYPGAYHAFDVPELRDGVRYLGHWVKYDADAAQRSISEVHDFLATELAK